jgi:hypothetical protein
MVTAKLKDINHMIFFFTTLRDLRPSLLRGLLVELSQDRAQYRQTLQLLRCIRNTDIKISGSKYFNRACRRSGIDTLAFQCYNDVIEHKLKEDDCFRVFNRKGYKTTANLAKVYGNLGLLFNDKGDLEVATKFLMQCLEIRRA